MITRGSAFTSRPVQWHKTDDVDFPYRAEVDGRTWQVRLNDFPAEPLYTLVIDGRPVEDLDEWPLAWQQP